MKPFCSGGLGDVDLLREFQDGELSRREICPFSFPEPIAPLVAARKHGRRITISAVLARIRALAARCDVLLVEGAGGLLAPLGEGFSALDLIEHLDCETIIVAANRLGTINHTRLTIQALEAGTWPAEGHDGAARASLKRLFRHKKSGGPGEKSPPRPWKLVLNDCGPDDLSTRSNHSIMAEFIGSSVISRLSHLGPYPLRKSALKRNRKKITKTLARILRCDTISPRSLRSEGQREKKSKKVRKTFDKR
jgi:dethiobiotin synthase